MERSPPARPWVRTRVPSPPTVRGRLASTHGDARPVTRGAGSEGGGGGTSLESRSPETLRCGRPRQLTPPPPSTPSDPTAPRGGRHARPLRPRLSVRRPSSFRRPHAGALQDRPSPRHHPRRALRPVGRSDPRKGRGHSPRRAHALSASRLRVGTRDAHPRVPSEATGR